MNSTELKQKFEQEIPEGQRSPQNQSVQKFVLNHVDDIRRIAEHETDDFSRYEAEGKTPPYFLKYGYGSGIDFINKMLRNMALIKNLPAYQMGDEIAEMFARNPKILPSDDELFELTAKRMLNTGRISSGEKEDDGDLDDILENMHWGSAKVSDDFLGKWIDARMNYLKHDPQRRLSFSSSQFPSLQHLSLGHFNREMLVSKSLNARANQALRTLLDKIDTHLSQHRQPIHSNLNNELHELFQYRPHLSKENKEKIRDILSKHAPTDDLERPSATYRLLRMIQSEIPTKDIIDTIETDAHSGYMNASPDIVFHDPDQERKFRMSENERILFFDSLLKERPDAIREIANRLDLLGETGPFTDYLKDEASEDYQNFSHNTRKLVSALTKMDDASRLKWWSGVDDTISKLHRLTVRKYTADGERLARTILEDGKRNVPLVQPNALDNSQFGNLSSLRPEAYYSYVKNLYDKAKSHFEKLGPEAHDNDFSMFQRMVDPSMTGTGVTGNVPEDVKKSYVDFFRSLVPKIYNDVKTGGVNSPWNRYVETYSLKPVVRDSLVFHAIKNKDMDFLHDMATRRSLPSRNSLIYPIDEHYDGTTDITSLPEMESKLDELVQNPTFTNRPQNRPDFMQNVSRMLRDMRAALKEKRGHYIPKDNNASEIDPQFADGYGSIAVKLGSSGLRELRAMAEDALEAGKKLVVSKLKTKLNPFRKTVENERAIDDWSLLTETVQTRQPLSEDDKLMEELTGEPAEPRQKGELYLSPEKIQAYKDYISTTPMGRSIVPKLDRLLAHVMETGNTKLSDLPPQLKSSPVKRKEKTIQVTPDWEPISTGGTLDLDKLNQKIEEIPDTNINYYTGQYVLGLQQHRDGRQKLFTIGVTPEQITKIREAGLYDLYNKLQNSLPIDNHPQGISSLGWVRWNEEPGTVFSKTKEGVPLNIRMPVPEEDEEMDPQDLMGHAQSMGWPIDHHIDEVQSDAADHIVKRVGKIKTGDVSVENPELITKKYAQLKDILFHGKEPGEVLHEAWQQHMRNQGRIGSNYGVWSHKSKKKMDISGLDVGRSPPVDWMINYGEQPERMGAEEAQYGSLAPQTSGNLKGEPMHMGKINKAEKEEDASLAHLFHAADDAAIEENFHRNPRTHTVASTLDELLGTPEGKVSLAAYLDRAAAQHHGHSVMEHLSNYGGRYFLDALKNDYQRMTGKNFFTHIGKHMIPNMAHKPHVENLDSVFEHILANTPQDQLEEVLNPLRGAPIVSNPAIVGTLANTVYQKDPAQLFSDFRIDPQIVNSLPYKAQLGYVVHEMEKPQQNARPPIVKKLVEDMAKGNKKVYDDLKTYSKFRNIDPESNEMYKSIMSANDINPELQLAVKHGSAALRKLRDYLKENGEKLPDELPKGQRWNTITKPVVGRDGSVNYVLDYNPLREKNGKLSEFSVQRYIDSIEPVTYDFETAPYQGVSPTMDPSTYSQFITQGDIDRMTKTKHSSDPQTILRIKLSNHDMDKLRATGADRAFNNLIEVGRRSGHPVSDRTVGWVRFSRGNDGNVFVDEAQSDFDTNFEALLRTQLKQMIPDISEEDLNANLQNFEQKLPKAHIEQIKQLAFGNRPPVEVLHEAFQQYGRNKGWDGSTWQTHSSKSKAPISLEMDKPMPPKFKENYEDTPKALGATPATYGKLDTQRDPEHAHLPGAPVWEEKLRQSEREE